MQPAAALKPWLAIAGAAAAFVLPVALLYHSGDAGFGGVGFLFSGRAFTDRPMITGGALDQPSLQKEWFIFCYSLVVVCPFLALVRWINRSCSRRVRPVFVWLSWMLLVHPLSILTVFTYDLSRYIAAMGATPRRLLGLALAITGYLVILRFGAWMRGGHPSNRHSNSIRSNKSEAG